MTAILVTRPAGEADALTKAGYRVHTIPMIATQPLKFDRPDLTRYDWVVVTSAAGVEALFPSPLQGRGSGRGAWAAVGQATGRALRAAGIEPSLIPDESNGLALANAIPDVASKRVLLVRAAAASPDLPHRLRERGATVAEAETQSAETLAAAVVRAIPVKERNRA
jgi:uroporphyrinogen-III synthase